VTVTTFPTDQLDARRRPGPEAASPGRPEAATDGELVRRAVADPGPGRGEARDELARRLRRPAYTLAYQLLGDREDALDVAQDALVRFFERLSRVDPERPVGPWLFAIVRNRTRDLLRRRKLRRTEPLTELRDPHPGPVDDALRHELRRQVWEGLAALPADQREILVLRDYQDLSYRDIAATLGVPVGTVMSRLHRARRALRDHIRPAGSVATTGRPS
jgi:RNA polymerase sigma-70 factor, ECF subfamily